ncbi:MAG: PAS domain S-box protein, partial [Candidatus Lokiarchaeota archaeon]|nr:PAS domain S-box protein [Candidatus Lokiarchaeota archaeon]
MISDKKNKYTNFENIFPYFMETVDDLIIIVSPDNSFKIEYIHKCEFLEQLGYSDGTLMGKSLLNLIDFGDNTSKTDLLKIIQQNKNKQDVKVINKNGKLTWAELISTIFSDEKNQQKLIVRLRDISKTKESEDKFRRIFESIPDIFFLLSEDTTILEYGGKEEDLYVPPKKFIGRRMCDILPPEIGLIAKKYVEKTLKTEQPHILEYKLPIKEEIHYYEGRFLYFSKNTIAVFIRDISERKKAEDKIKESEDKFRTIAEQSLMGICIIQDFEIKYLNHQMAEIYGYPIDEVRQWKPKEFMKVIHPDSKEMMINQLTKKQQGSEDIIIHYIAKIIKKSGNIRYVENYSKPIDYQGQPANLITQIDITAKMNAEQKLKESEAKYRSLFENMNAGFAYHKVIVNYNNDPIDYKYLEVNPAFEKLTGLKKEDLIGKTVTEAIPGTENDPADW